MDPAHILSRGAGRVDIRANILSLCRKCHSSSHDGGRPTQDDMLQRAAEREKCLPSDIQESVWYIRRLDKHADSAYVQANPETLTAVSLSFILEAIVV